VKRPYVFKGISFQTTHINFSLADYLIKGVEILHLIYSWPTACFITCKYSIFLGGDKENGFCCVVLCTISLSKFKSHCDFAGALSQVIQICWFYWVNWVLQ